MVQRFLPLLAENSSENFQIGTVTPDSANETMAMIDSRIERAGGQPVRVSWRVRQSDGTFKILDNVAEGVSMAIALASEYGKGLKENGGRRPTPPGAPRAKSRGG